MKNSINLVLAFVLMPIVDVVGASSEAVERLRQAMIENDADAFHQILDSGAIDFESFAKAPPLYEIACFSAYEGASEFLEKLLQRGLDPSTEDPEKSLYRFSLLACAERGNGLQAFEMLVDAGARTDILLCDPCVTRTPEPLVERVLRRPEMFAKITEQRNLTDSEMATIARNIENVRYHGTWQGQPLNEFYADYLRERGIDVTPKTSNR